MCFPPGKKSESTCCHHWIIWICPSSVQYHLNSANFDKHKCSNFTFFPAWFFRFGIVSGVNHRFAKFHHFFKQKSKEDLKKGTIFFHGTFHHLHKKKWWMVQCCLPKDWLFGLFPFRPRQVLLEGSKDPTCWVFSCDVASKIPEVSIEIPRIFFGISGWFPQIQRRLGPWVVKHFFAWWFATWWSIVYPIPEVETPNFQGILIIICQKTINHELSSVKHLQLRMISQLQKFWSSFYWFLAWISATYPWNPNQTKSHQVSRTLSQHPRLRPSIKGWIREFVRSLYFCEAETYLTWLYMDVSENSGKHPPKSSH